MNILDAVAKDYMKSNIPAFNVGDQVKVHIRIKEGNRERVQVFEGFVLKRQNGGIAETFTVRKMSSGVGVEKTFPLHSPWIEKIEVTRHGDVRRAKLNYMRERTGKAAKIKIKDGASLKAAQEESYEAEQEATVAEAVEAAAEETAEDVTEELTETVEEATETVEEAVDAVEEVVEEKTEE
ncbi:MAG: 50S ribosomal protein L19 [Firmicutes bacterium]|nr:50S ribosomal protein L19 [Bacillota bacterium]